MTGIKISRSNFNIVQERKRHVFCVPGTREIFFSRDYMDLVVDVFRPKEIRGKNVIIKNRGKGGKHHLTHGIQLSFPSPTPSTSNERGDQTYKEISSSKLIRASKRMLKQINFRVKRWLSCCASISQYGSKKIYWLMECVFYFIFIFRNKRVDMRTVLYPKPEFICLLLKQSRRYDKHHPLRKPPLIQ